MKMPLLQDLEYICIRGQLPTDGRHSFATSKIFNSLLLDNFSKNPQISHRFFPDPLIWKRRKNILKNKTCPYVLIMFSTNKNQANYG